MIICETPRLRLRLFNLDDAQFILKLVNQQSWIDNIGDRNVHTLEDARRFIENGPLSSYKANGYGFYVVEEKETGNAVGICGLVDRDGLDTTDLGYALLDDYAGQGYAIEASRAVVEYAWKDLKKERLLAITSEHNPRSISLLHRLGMSECDKVRLPGEEEMVRLFELMKQM